MELNRIYQGDCLDYLRSLPDGVADLVVTDPPYGVSYRTSRRSDSDPLVKDIENDSGDWLPFARDWFKEVCRVLKNDRHFYCFGSFVTAPEMQRMIGGGARPKERTRMGQTQRIGRRPGRGLQQTIRACLLRAQRTAAIERGEAIREHPAGIAWKRSRLRASDAETRRDNFAPNRMFIESWGRCA